MHMAGSGQRLALDIHCLGILDQYRQNMPVYELLEKKLREILAERIAESGLYVTAVETRIKKEDSLIGKLELKGSKYQTIYDITDIVGGRVITFYSEEVDKIASLLDHTFEVDWQNSVDKRKMHELNSFGYNSLHYICRIPESLYSDPDYPQLNNIRFEIQMRTALQHVWSTMNHDMGYKNGVDIPKEHLRSMNRLSGLLELVDEQFTTIRSEIIDYRRKALALVDSGDFDQVRLDTETFRSYLQLKPFDKLNCKIASLNHAEIHESTLMPYLQILLDVGFKTLGDVEKLIADHFDDAYHLAMHQLGNTDIDIISSTVGIQNLLQTYIVANGGGKIGLKRMYDQLLGESDANMCRAEKMMADCRQLPFMNE